MQQKIRNIFLIIFIAICNKPIAFAQKCPVNKLSEMAKSMEWIGKAVDDPDYYVWCTSPIMIKNNVHLYCSRWPKKLGMDGWSTHSEIAHYVGDKPEGPFTFVDLSIPSNPGAEWMNAIHNPSIKKVGDTYVLLYITFDRRKDSPYRKGELALGGKMLTCMSTSKSPNGPWKRQGEDGLIIKPSMDSSHYS